MDAQERPWYLLFEKKVLAAQGKTKTKKELKISN